MLSRIETCVTIRRDTALRCINRRRWKNYHGLARYGAAFTGRLENNIENGEGKDADQYKAARNLAAKLNAAGKQFNIAGYSKGGGLVQEAGLVSPHSKVYVQQRVAQFRITGAHRQS